MAGGGGSWVRGGYLCRELVIAREVMDLDMDDGILLLRSRRTFAYCQAGSSSAIRLCSIEQGFCVSSSFSWMEVCVLDTHSSPIA